MNDFAPSDTDDVHLRAYDASNNLLASDFQVIPSTGPGVTLTVSSATSIAPVEWNESGDFEGAVYRDNLTCGSATPAVPEPETYALMAMRLVVTGFIARRRRPAR